MLPVLPVIGVIELWNFLARRHHTMQKARRRHTFEFSFQTSAKQQRMRDPVDPASLLKRRNMGISMSKNSLHGTSRYQGRVQVVDLLTCGGVT